MYDIDKEILYWIDQFGWEWINCGELIDYIKENYVKSQEDVVNEFVEVMEWRVDIDYLNKDAICENDNDYEHICDDLYLNIYRLECDEIELKRLNLIK